MNLTIEHTRESRGTLAVAAADKYYCNSRGAFEPLDSINISHRRRGQTRERANVALLNTLQQTRSDPFWP